jgi:aminoglycoside 6'-N-acetyltransferase
VGAKFAGWVQFGAEDYGYIPGVALDIALTTELHGCGYGRRALRLAVYHFVAKGYHRFTIDPRVDNERAIRSSPRLALGRLGSARIRAQPTGGWEDALLMDLIVREGDWG